MISLTEAVPDDLTLRDFVAPASCRLSRGCRVIGGVGEDAHRTAAGRRCYLFGFCERGISLPGLSSNDRLPVQNRVPHHAMITAVQIAMQRVKVECDHMSATHRHVENRGTADQASFTPGLTADHEGCTVAIAPFQNDVAAILRTVKASGAVGHAQPVSWNVVQREILAEDMRAGWISVGQGRVGTVEGYAHVRARCACCRLLGCRGR